MKVVIIGGLGHIGLPLGIVLANAGVDVGLCDLNEWVYEEVTSGKMPFMEEGGEEMLSWVLERKKAGKVKFDVVDLEEIADADTVIITVGTPIDEYMSPRFKGLTDLATRMVQYLKPDHHVILRSTVFPGTTRTLHSLFAEKGVAVDLSFCPERVVQGKAIEEIIRLPQIISGVTPGAVEKTRELFDKIGCKVVEVSVGSAELAKLFTNAWRYISFSISNAFFTMAQESGANFADIYRAMTEDYPRAASLPKPGFAAGPCLLKDTMQLVSAFPRFKLGQEAFWVNETLPDFLANRLANEYAGDLFGKTVGILGMSFKADIDDTRDSLSFRLAKVLRFKGATVLCTDEYAEDPSFSPIEEVLERSDIIVIAVPHKRYSEIGAGELWTQAPVIDLFNLYIPEGML